jgi:hypothetical protein
MALPAIDLLLAAVVTAFLSAYPPVVLDRLAIDDYACTGLRISVQANSKAFAHSSVDTFPGTVNAPFSEIVVDGVGQVRGKSCGSMRH